MLRKLNGHGGALLRRAEKFHLLQFALEPGEERGQLLLGGGRRLSRHGERQRAAGCELEPFIGDDGDCLRQIERSESGIDRQGNDRVGEADLVVFQPVALAPEHHRDRLARGDARRGQPRSLIGAEHGLGLIMRARGRGENEMAVGDRGLDGVEQRGGVEDAVGARGHDHRLAVGPGAARLDEAQPRQPEIPHGARRRADILAELRLDQHDHRAGGVRPVLGLVGSGAGHLALRSAIHIRAARKPKAPLFSRTVR